ncbi:MAG: Ig-like domain-containing protein [Candidatus Eisenbacteria bacterium]|uniref:Cadherin-like domain-containing protein n=1 Tax=Eiseniibacteriota bacterium TaxID=2212470 RepID=A0A956RQS8_UNCEI|nr:cadherin-like domain-containing protein [Candidatus Eisenbacteria bacterium]
MVGAAVFCLLAAGAARAQNPIAVDDAYEVPAGDHEFSVNDGDGVLANDTDAQGENLPDTAVAELVSDVAHGTLDLLPTGAFTYTPVGTYEGVDTFVYHVVDGPLVSNDATVTLDVCGCVGTAPQLTCTTRTAFVAKLAELGYTDLIDEGFEDGAVWPRNPAKLPAVVSQGITWTSNQPTGFVTTSNGASRSGQWGVYSSPHGRTSGNPLDPQRDGFVASTSGTLVGAGGYIHTGTPYAGLEFVLTMSDSSNLVVSFPNAVVTTQALFWGVIDTRGFTAVEFVETEGVLEDAKVIFGDDFTLALDSPASIPPASDGIRLSARPLENPSSDDATLLLTLPRASEVGVEILDASGRRVFTTDLGRLDEGPHRFTWNGRDGENRVVPGGAYFYRVATDAGTVRGKLIRLPH